MVEWISYISGFLALALFALYLIETAAGLDLIAVPICNWLARKLGLQAKPGEARIGATGVEGLLGSEGTVTAAFSVSASDQARAQGKILCQGSTWTAALANDTAAHPQVGEKVKIVELDGLALVVEPID